MINLTPHAVSVQLPDGSTVTYPPSGTTARVAMDECPQGTLDGVPVITRRAVAVESLPAEGMCIVSAMVLDALTDSHDCCRCVAPDSGATAIRDDQGRILAVTRWVRR